MIVDYRRGVKREIANLERRKQSRTVLGGYIVVIHMLIKHITRYDVGEQVGRNRQAVRSLFQVDKRGNLKSTVGGIAVRHVKFVEQAVSVGLTNLAYIVVSGYNTAVGIDSTPIKFQLLFEIAFIAVFTPPSGR